MNYEYIIVGGGLLGSATAYQLAKMGAKGILVVDRNEIASQASSRAACLLTRVRSKALMMDIVAETYRCIDEIEDLTGESLELQTTGSITIASSEGSLAGLKVLEDAANSYGIPCETIDNVRLKELLPWIETKDVLESLFVPSDAYIDSALLCMGYANGAKKLGVEYRSCIGVSEIIVDEERVQGVKLDSGEVLKSQVVINCAGAWSNLLMKSLNIGLPMTPVRSHFWISDVNKELFPAGHPFTVIPDAKAFTRADVGALMVGLREGTCLSFDPSTLTPSLDDYDFSKGGKWTILDECAPLFERFFPAIADLGIAHYVSGPSCYVPDAMFVIGEIERYKGLYTVCGCCGAGVASGGGMGRLMAEIVLGRDTFVDPTPFKPSRFGEIDPFSYEFQISCAEARSNKRSG